MAIFGKEKDAPAAEAGSAKDVDVQKKTASERSAERVAAKKAASVKLKDEAVVKMKKANEEFLKGPSAPVFVPFKDANGQIWPALILTGSEELKRDASGDLEVNETTREAIPEYRFRVVVFSGAARDPYQADWKP